MTCEDIGELTKVCYTLSPSNKEDTLQIGSVIIHPFEKGFCETIPDDHYIVVSHTEIRDDL